MTTDTAHVLADATDHPGGVLRRDDPRPARQPGVPGPPTRAPGGVDHDHPHTPGAADAEQYTREQVLHAILATSGAESSAHEAIRVEQDRAGSIAQLADEAETIAAYAHLRATADLLARTMGDPRAVQRLVASHDFPRLVAAVRGAHTAGLDPQPMIATASGQNGPASAAGLAEAVRRGITVHRAIGHRAPPQRFIAGLLPDATAGLTDPSMLTAVRERYTLIEQRADAILDHAIQSRAAWLRNLPVTGHDAQGWRATARLVAAYRDRWAITADTHPLGPTPQAGAVQAQQADHRHVTMALTALRTRPTQARPAPVGVARAERSL